MLDKVFCKVFYFFSSGNVVQQIIISIVEFVKDLKFVIITLIDVSTFSLPRKRT